MDDTELIGCKYCGEEVEVEVETISDENLRCPTCGIILQIPEYILMKYAKEEI